MRVQDLNLLPASARERVLQAQEMSRSCGAALALVAIATLTAIGAELGRQDAARHFDQLEAKAEGVRARDEHRRRLEAEVEDLTLRAEMLRGADREMPILPLLGAVGRALPAGTRLEQFSVRGGPDGFRGEFAMLGSAADLEQMMNALSAVRPFTDLKAPEARSAERTAVRRASFALSGGGKYQVVYDDADVHAESAGDAGDEEVGNHE